MDIKHEEAPLPNEQRQLVINGKRYHGATANKCPTCAAGQNFLFIKMKLAGGDNVLECPVCDSSFTVSEAMVLKNLDKAR